MDEENRYTKNLELFSRDNPLQAFHFQKKTSLKFCKTAENEVNLVDDMSIPSIYFHSQEGALKEAEYWAGMLPLETCDVIFVYGLGLGYYYLPLKEWLKNPDHYLVFIENNFDVVQLFLQTELASHILENKQIIVKFLPKFEPTEDGWAQMRITAADIINAFALFKQKSHITALQTYLLTQFEYFKMFSLQWITALSIADREIFSFYPYPALAFHNFYANIWYLSEAIPGYALAGAMKSLPAIICGAGPSLSKQLPQLKTLSDNAFLMASGSAMNVLTHAGITPHVGGAIDHTPTQASRLLTSFGFEVPAFYQNRFFDEAFTKWHGPLLHIGGSENFRISEWFEKELGIQVAERIIMGVSTSNFLLEMANFLGCDPIILVGMDLAYTDNERYAKGVLVHSADDEKEHRALVERQQVTIPVPGVQGEDVYTTNHWFYESVCIAAFKQRNPEIIFLNATEGGMDIPLVPNVNFSETIDSYFHEAFDIQGWFHGAIQNASKQKIPSEDVFKTIGKWKKSLEACKSYLNNLIEFLQQDLIKQEQVGCLLDLYQGKAISSKYELQQEPAYEFFLEATNCIFEAINYLWIRKLKWFDGQELALEKIAIEIARYQFLNTYVQSSLTDIEEGGNAFHEHKKLLSRHIDQKDRLKHRVAPSEYRTEKSISIQEADLNIHLKVPFCPQLIPADAHPKKHQESAIEALIGKVNDEKEGQALYFYPDGKVKAEAFYHQGRLHGPWSFYSESGTILYRSWFIEGIREGKSCSYYLDGEVYSVLGYRNGLFQGEQLYYYPDGTLKTVEHYEEGVLEGVVQLYYSNGQLKKEQNFLNGKLHGQERMWIESGVLSLEAFYEHGKEVGTSRKWHHNGKLVREVVHGAEE